MKGLKAEKDKQRNVKKKDKNKAIGVRQGVGDAEKEGEGEEEGDEGKGGDVLYRVLEARQLAIKLLANVTCKYCVRAL